MSQALGLYRLQQIDSQIDHLQTRLIAIQGLLDNDSELQQINQRAETANARCRAAEQALQQAEEDVQNQHIKIEHTQSSLYAEKSHSPKELQDLQNDVNALKRYLVILEDRQIDAMQESETAEADHQIIQAGLNDALEGRVEQDKGLHLEQTLLRNDLERFLIERNAAASAIPANEFDLYEKLRCQRRGVAVAVINEDSCGACGSNLSLAQIQSAHSSGQIILCPSCGRILYGK